MKTLIHLWVLIGEKSLTRLLTAAQTIVGYNNALLYCLFESIGRYLFRAQLKKVLGILIFFVCAWERSHVQCKVRSRHSLFACSDTHK